MPEIFRGTMLGLEKENQGVTKSSNSSTLFEFKRTSGLKENVAAEHQELSGAHTMARLRQGSRCEEIDLRIGAFGSRLCFIENLRCFHLSLCYQRQKTYSKLWSMSVYLSFVVSNTWLCSGMILGSGNYKHTSRRSFGSSIVLTTQWKELLISVGCVTIFFQYLCNTIYEMRAEEPTASEIDIRIGASFSRFRSMLLKDALNFNFSSGNICFILSHGPCQFPTLGFVVERYWELLAHEPEGFRTINCSLNSEEGVANFYYSCAVINYELCVG